MHSTFFLISEFAVHLADLQLLAFHDSYPWHLHCHWHLVNCIPNHLHPYHGEAPALSTSIPLAICVAPAQKRSCLDQIRFTLRGYYSNMAFFLGETKKEECSISRKLGDHSHESMLQMHLGGGVLYMIYFKKFMVDVISPILCCDSDLKKCWILHTVF